jgi:PAS domain-containing protein
MNKSFVESNFTDNNKYKLILESINEIVWEANLTTFKLQIIGEFNNFAGYTNSEIISLMDYADKIIIHEDKDRVKYEFSEFLKGNSILLNIQYRIRTKCGQIKWILINGKKAKLADN